MHLKQVKFTVNKQAQSFKVYSKVINIIIPLFLTW